MYAVIISKFRESRKRLEALEKQNEDSYYMIKEPKFQMKFWKFAKTLKPKIPGIIDEGIYIIRYKNESYQFTHIDMDKPRKRRSSSVVKSLSILASHVRAATYILVIVSIYLATWAPFYAFSVYKSLTKLNLPTEKDGDVSDDIALNVTFLKSCLSSALQDKNTSIKAENITTVNSFTKLILQSMEMKIMSNILGNYVSMLNSFANPVLYAL